MSHMLAVQLKRAFPLWVSIFLAVGLAPSLRDRVVAQEIETSGDPAIESSLDSSTLDEADSNTLQGNPKPAIEKYTIILSRHPNNARALFNRGSARILERDYSGALDDLQKAANLFEQRGKLKLRDRSLAQIALIRSIYKP